MYICIYIYTFRGQTSESPSTLILLTPGASTSTLLLRNPGACLGFGA